MRRGLSTLLVIAGALALLSNSPTAAQRRGNRPDPNRRIPREGVEVPVETRAELVAGLQELGDMIDSIHAHEEAWIQRLAPDVEIFHRAVAQALEHQEFLSERDLAAAPKLIAEGSQRATDLLSGTAPWTKQTGLVALGYTSTLDGTVQPYGLLVPESYSFEGDQSSRLDVWLHGRNESICEVGFLNQQLTNRQPIAPPGALVLLPFGRYSNAFRFAGEVDVWESLTDAKRRYRVDDDRTSIRGFSMGGAGCWHLAIHHADRFFAANPGAGFSETAEFLGIYRARNGRTPTPPPWYQVKLWNLHDGPGHAINLYHCPTVGYSGEVDRQKQATDVMEKALEEHGINLVHIIGPKTGHKIHPDSKLEIEARLASLSKRGRQQMPRTVHFATYTLKYNRLHWVQIDALGAHWQQARVDASITGESTVSVTTTNVRELTLAIDSGWCPLAINRPVELTIDGQHLEAPRPMSDRSWLCQLRREGDSWRVGPASGDGLRKRSGLQGPIDDAFLESFVFVRPTGTSDNAKLQAWADAEFQHAVAHWRQHFRGDARVKNDEDITDEDIAAHNLILFGDLNSNSVLKQIAGDLPVRWTNELVRIGDSEFPAANHAPILAYPNPLNQSKYVVLNSGFTFREYDYYNNARQTPKLPDWAIVDIGVPADNRAPGKIVAANFFDETWQVKSGGSDEN